MKKLVTFIQKTKIDYILAPVLVICILWLSVINVVQLFKNLGISEYFSAVLAIIFAIVFVRLLKPAKKATAKTEPSGKPVYTLYAKE